MPGARDGRIRVAHRELVSVVTGAVNFATTPFAINPGLSFFPWLSGLAKNFEKYQFSRLQFRYVPMKGTMTSGRVALAPDYDASDAAPETVSDMMSAHSSVSGCVYAPLTLVCDASNLAGFGSQRFVRAGPLAANSDIKTYDVLQLFVGVYGCADLTMVGELYAEYSVDLITPQRITSLDMARNSLRLQISTATLEKPLGTALPGRLGNLDAPYSVDTGALSFGLNEGVTQYLMDYVTNGNTITQSPTFTTNNCTVTPLDESTIATGGARLSRSFRLAITGRNTVPSFIPSMAGNAVNVNGGATLTIAPFSI